jgi:PAS domain S-box-containing protein
MNEKNPSVFVVDDDASMRDSLKNLIGSAGLAVRTFASAQEFLTSQRPDGAACLVLDVQLPGLSGLDLQQELAKVDAQIPIIFITAHGDIPTTFRAMKAGAIEFLTKPFRGEDLLNAVAQAIKRSREIEQSPGRKASIDDLKFQIAAREKAETAVLKLATGLEAKVRRLVEANIIGIVIWNVEGRILEANEAFLRMVGYGREDLVSGRVSWREVTPDKWRAADERALAEVTATGVCEPFEKEYFRKDGSRVPVLVGAALLEGSGKEGVAFVLDLTERKRAEAERLKLEERLRQAEKMEAIGRLAGGIAHDFNNVLGGIFAFGEMLYEEAPESSSRKRHARNLLTAAARGRALVEQILAHSRSQGGKREPTDIGRMVAETLELVRGSLPPNITVESRAAGLSLVVMSDATQLHQVIMNLCSNAIHALGKGGTLRVALAASDVGAEHALSQGRLTPGRYACLTVADNGCGMDAATLACIFEPFFTTKEIGRGTGLGLSLVSSIVTDLGGVIDVKSAPAQGSTFAIYLPLAGIPVAAAA